jgi:hypothetical protein
MRLALDLDDELIRDLDALRGTRTRDDFIAHAIRKALDSADRDRRWTALRRAAGGISDGGHEWDEDPAAWVHESRRADPRRIG